MVRHVQHLIVHEHKSLSSAQQEMMTLVQITMWENTHTERRRFVTRLDPVLRVKDSLSIK